MEERRNATPLSAALRSPSPPPSVGGGLIESGLGPWILIFFSSWEEGGIRRRLARGRVHARVSRVRVSDMNHQIYEDTLHTFTAHYKVVVSGRVSKIDEEARKSDR